MKSEFGAQRSTTERVVIGALIVLGTVLLLGIQSLFLNHIASALPADPLWRIVTIACFLAPPFAFAFLVLLKMNFSRSTSQDYILYVGMAIELVLFVVNMIVAVSAQQIEGTLLGMIGVLLGGIAGIVSAGTTAFTLAADPLRGLAKSKIEHDLKMEKTAQSKTETLAEQAMSSPRVLAAAENYAEEFVRERFEQVFGRRISERASSQSAPLQVSAHSGARELQSNAPLVSPTPSNVVANYQFDDQAREDMNIMNETILRFIKDAENEGIVLTETYDMRQHQIGDRARLDAAYDYLKRLRVEYEHKKKEQIVLSPPKFGATYPNQPTQNF